MLLQKRLKNKKTEIPKPEWLKQWTISKGWMHDRSHMLSLGTGDKILENPGLDDNSSIDNASDLISIIELEEPKNESNRKQIDDLDRIEVDKTDIYSEINVNYRKSFPVRKEPIYEELPLTKFLKAKENEIQYSKIIFPSRQKLFKKSSKSWKVGKYKTFDDLTVLNYEEEKKRKNSRLFPEKHNIQQDTIYECSEDSISLYQNPIYQSNTEFNNVQLLEDKSNLTSYFSFNQNNNCPYQKYLKNDLNTKKLSTRQEFMRKHHLGTLRSKLSTEKYIIRHIRIRIMLSLRLRKFQRLYRKKMRSEKQSVLFKKRQNLSESDTMRDDILRVHDEQRRIGNGKSSLKIQNLR